MCQVCVRLFLCMPGCFCCLFFVANLAALSVAGHCDYFKPRSRTAHSLCSGLINSTTSARRRTSRSYFGVVLQISHIWHFISQMRPYPVTVVDGVNQTVGLRSPDRSRPFTSFGQPTRLITCANHMLHGNDVICSRNLDSLKRS